jgi:hypothetical protein
MYWRADALAARQNVGAAARPLLLGDRDLRGVDVEPQRQQRHRAMVGHRDRRAGKARREGVQIVLDPVLDAQGIAQIGDAGDLGWDEDEQPHEVTAPEPGPRRRHGCPRGSSAQPKAPAPQKMARMVAGPSR